MRVTKITKITTESLVPVYDLSVIGTENFCLANGCVVHNSKDLLDSLVGSVWGVTRSQSLWVGLVADSDVVQDDIRSEMGERHSHDDNQRR